MAPRIGASLLPANGSAPHDWLSINRPPQGHPVCNGCNHWQVTVGCRPLPAPSKSSLSASVWVTAPSRQLSWCLSVSRYAASNKSSLRPNGSGLWLSPAPLAHLFYEDVLPLGALGSRDHIGVESRHRPPSHCHRHRSGRACPGNVGSWWVKVPELETPSCLRLNPVPQNLVLPGHVLPLLGVGFLIRFRRGIQSLTAPEFPQTPFTGLVKMWL